MGGSLKVEDSSFWQQKSCPIVGQVPVRCLSGNLPKKESKGMYED